jgi:hypothetical protein
MRISHISTRNLLNFLLSLTLAFIGLFVCVFKALLADLVRDCEVEWTDARRSLKGDRRWADVVATLGREELEEIFNKHCDNLKRKKREKFR